MSRVNTVLAEFVPRVLRCCNDVSWNSVQPNLFASALDRDRKDASVYVWDVERAGDISMPAPPIGAVRNAAGLDMFDIASARASCTTVKTAVCTFGASEGAAACSWESSTRVAVGTLARFLRIYDTRQANTAAAQSVVAHSKAVLGCSWDPQHKRYLLTYGGGKDATVKVWDTRVLRSGRPLFEMSPYTNCGIRDAQWSPDSSSIATVSQGGGDDAKVSVWALGDLGAAESILLDDLISGSSSTGGAGNNNNDDNGGGSGASGMSETSGNPASVVGDVGGEDDQATDDPDAQPKAALLPVSATVDLRHQRRYISRYPIASFAWHPSESDRIVVLSAQGTLESLKIGRSIPTTWSALPGAMCLWSRGKQALLQLKDVSAGDVSSEMMERARLGYSVHASRNKELCKNFHGKQNNANVAVRSDLVVLWSWMAYMQDSKFKHQGAVSLVQQHQQEASVMVPGPLPSWDGPGRQAVIEVCEACAEAPGGERKAAMLLLAGQLDAALLCLSAGQEALAAALAGWVSNNAAWCKAALKLAPHCHPTMGAALRLLAEPSTALPHVLQDATVPLRDRVSMACSFLADSALLTWLQQMAQKEAAKGNLECVLLTGLQKAGLPLLQTYIDRTADVQTAALCVSAVVPSRFRDPLAERWIEAYRTLLDRWGMWEQRALLDVGRRQEQLSSVAASAALAGSVGGGGAPPVAAAEEALTSASIAGVARLGQNAGVAPTQIYVRCNNCDQSLSLSMMAPAKLALRTALGTSTRGSVVSRLKACPNPKCRETLPKCALCLLPMECSAPLGMSEATPADATSLQDNFFTFCTVCRHGGHPEHLLEWFRTNTVCPVSDCPCTECCGGGPGAM